MYIMMSTWGLQIVLETKLSSAMSLAKINVLCDVCEREGQFVCSRLSIKDGHFQLSTLQLQMTYCVSIERFSVRVG